MFFSESETVELKSIYVDDIKKEIVAFANTRGGKIYIGVESDGSVCGVDDADFVILQVSSSARDAIKPDVTMFMRYNVLSIENKNVIEKGESAALKCTERDEEVSATLKCDERN